MYDQREPHRISEQRQSILCKDRVTERRPLTDHPFCQMAYGIFNPEKLNTFDKNKIDMGWAAAIGVIISLQWSFPFAFLVFD